MLVILVSGAFRVFVDVHVLMSVMRMVMDVNGPFANAPPDCIETEQDEHHCHSALEPLSNGSADRQLEKKYDCARRHQ